MKKIILYLFVLAVLLMIVGCQTPPWTDKELDTMRSHEVECVPVFMKTF